MRISPTLEGFRAAFRRPALTLAEISWRWTVGGAATALFAFSLLEYLDTLRVTRGDMLLLRTRQPVLVGQALGHIFRGSLPRVVMAGLVAAVALTCLWIFAASVGRATTVRSLIDHFAERLKSIRDGELNDAQENDSRESDSAVSGRLADSVTPPPKESRVLGTLLRLNFLRAAVALASILGLVGAVIVVLMVSAAFASNSATKGVTIVGSAPPPPNPSAGLAFLLFFPLAGLVFLAWFTLNWVLSLAGMFAVCAADVSRDARGALSAAVGFCRERTGPVFAVSTWTGLAHLTVFVVATTAVSVPLGLVNLVPGRVVLGAVILITVVYFATADWLYMARLAGYVCIAEIPEALLERLPRLPQSAPLAQTAVDRDEVILSDLPNLA